MNITQETVGNVLVVGPGLCRLNDNIQRVFEMSGLNRILDIEGSREAALSKYF